MKNLVRGITCFGLLSVWPLTAFAEDQPDLARFDAKVMVDNSVIKKLEDSGWTKKLFR